MAMTYRDPQPSPFLIRALGALNRAVVLPGIARIERIDLPGRDLARLRQAVTPTTAAFITPNHPEFMTDWMLDREMACHVSPRMASWATHEIVHASRLTHGFWLANGLIANAPGGGGKAFSVRHARAGHGVLLHPEGRVNWQAERIGPLMPGATDMALHLAATLDAEGDARPVFIVPIVWRPVFAIDAAPGLIDEMRLIERHCGVHVWPTTDPGERLGRLLSALLVARAHQLGLAAPALDPAEAGRGYFTAQAGVLDDIRGRLRAATGVRPSDDSAGQWRRAVTRAMRRASLDSGQHPQLQRWLDEYQRLTHLDPALYGGPTLSQEHIAEILKATRAALVTSGWRNRLHNLLPRPVAPRVAHVRVAEPIDVRAASRFGAATSALQQQLAGRLQRALDQLSTELESGLQRRRALNPMGVDDDERDAHDAWCRLGA